MFNFHKVAFLFILLTTWSHSVVAQSDIASRFSGIYQVEDGPQQVQFVLYAQQHELLGNIVVGGRDHPLTATVDGLTLKGVFGPDNQRQFLRMPLSNTSHFQVTFADGSFGSWSFLRLPLPRFTGEFSGDFGSITLKSSGQGIVYGEYETFDGEPPMGLRGTSRGLEAVLEGAVPIKLLYSLDQRRYFAEVNGRFSSVNYKTPEALRQEQRNRINRDNYAWDKALRKRTEMALEQYRRDWPDGRHVEEIDAVKQQWHWQDTLASGRFEDFHAHTKRFPNGLYYGQADNAAWAITKAQNKDGAFDQYLQSFPGGSHIKAAKAGKETLAWRRASREDSIKGYGKYAKLYPNGAHIESADESAWRIAQGIQSVTAFNTYRRAFPQGLFAAQVEDAKRNVELIIADNQAFKQAQKRNSQAGFESYLAQYPEGRHANKARKGIDRLIALRKAEKDDAAWHNALAAQSESAINFYAINWPNGRHIDAVPTALKRLKQIEFNQLDNRAFAIAQKQNTQASYEHYLSKYHDGMHKDKAQSAINTFKRAAKAKQDQLIAIQDKLNQLNFLDVPPNGVLDLPTKSAVLKAQRAMKVAPTGKADSLLDKQLDSVIAFNTNLKSAKEDSVKHMLAVAKNFEHGNGTQTNSAQAMKWYKKAAEEGNAQAMAKYASSFVSGKNKDPKQAVKWLKKSIRLGSIEGMYQLGLLYYKGQGVPQHNKKALGWITRAAENGHAPAMKYLGDIYAQGKGVKKNISIANQWYEKAAAHIAE